MPSERVDLRMPNVGNGVESAIVYEWLIGVGEIVNEGDPVVTMETDKATSDLDAPVSGTLVEVAAPDGAEVEVGGLIGVFEAAG
jgi:pyruvate/2-oxoglutarate dehydrogenase complex dihydrolipoamide acyltransferase (E2) component